MKKLITTKAKYEKLWLRMKGNLRISTTEMARYPLETDEEYSVRMKEVVNPSMPRSITYWTKRGPVLISY